MVAMKNHVLVSLFMLALSSMSLSFSEEIRDDLKNVKYSDWYQVTSHNFYENYGDVGEVLAKVSSIEYDVHPSSNWAVYHSDDNYAATRCHHSLNVCLKELREWHDEHKGHAPVTVFIEIKNDKGFKVKDFNGIFCGPKRSAFAVNRDDAVFACSELYRPGDLLVSNGKKYTSLRNAANANNWQTVEQLKDKIIFVVNGPSSSLGKYMHETIIRTGDNNKNKNEASAFVMVDDVTTTEAIDTLCNKRVGLKGKCDDKNKYYDALHDRVKNVVFLNATCDTWSNQALGKHVHSKHYLSRGYTCDHQDDPKNAVTDLATPRLLNFVAYDKIENAFSGFKIE